MKILHGFALALFLEVGLFALLGKAYAQGAGAIPATTAADPSNNVIVALTVMVLLAGAMNLLDSSDIGAKIPSAWTPRIAAAIGLVSGVMQYVVQGLSWKQAFVAAASAVVGAVAGVSGVSASRRSLARSKLPPNASNEDVAKVAVAQTKAQEQAEETRP